MLSLTLGLALLFITLIVAAIVVVAILESDRWIRTDDPTVVQLIENYEKLDENKRQVIRDIADDG